MRRLTTAFLFSVLSVNATFGAVMAPVSIDAPELMLRDMQTIGTSQQADDVIDRYEDSLSTLKKASSAEQSRIENAQRALLENRTDAEAIETVRQARQKKSELDASITETENKISELRALSRQLKDSENLAGKEAECKAKGMIAEQGKLFGWNCVDTPETKKYISDVQNAEKQYKASMKKLADEVKKANKS